LKVTQYFVSHKLQSFKGFKAGVIWPFGNNNIINISY
jgi:hypothetical protein